MILEAKKLLQYTEIKKLESISKKDGSGIGGLCCGSILALAGKKVLIAEAHSQPGGVAHSFNMRGYKFESGPSLWSGIGKWPTTNPLGLSLIHI